MDTIVLERWRICVALKFWYPPEDYTQRHNPEDHNLNMQRHENLKLLWCITPKWKTIW